MKTLKIGMILLVLTTGIAKAQFTKAELQVSGLTCALCAKATEKSLRTLPYISDIKPDLIHNIFVITFKNGLPVNFDEISKKVQDAGFFVNSLKTTIICKARIHRRATFKIAIGATPKPGSAMI